MPTVARINVTPVKSTALQHPSEVRLEVRGPVHDRLFCLVDEHGRRFGGDPQVPLMLVGSEFDAARDRMRLRLPDGRELEGPATADGAQLFVDYFGVAVGVHEVVGDWSRFLSDHVGRPIRLVRLDEPGGIVDEPVSVVSLASVRELARRGGSMTTLEAERFRMTLELEGCEPHEEDSWSGRRVAAGDAELVVGEPVGRCVIATINPATGRQDFPALKVIGGYRAALPSGAAPFGMFAKVPRPGMVRVGDDVAAR